MNLLHPAWLILLVLPPLLAAAALATSRLRGASWSVFTAPRLRGALIKHASHMPYWFSLVFLLAALAAMITAMARPQGDAGTRSEKSLGRNVLIALDLSRSMLVQDVKPDRLSQAKMTVYELLDALPNERIGLIGFAGTAYVYAPLTVDHRAVRETVEQINPDWVTRGGTNFADAMRLAIQTLKETGQKNNALVFISDGEKHDSSLDDLIDEAVKAGVFIVAVGVGTEDGDYVPNPDFPQGRMVDRSGQPVISRLQSGVLRQLALETRGRYAVASSGGIPALVQDVVTDLDSFVIKGRERTIAVEFYQWLLLPAILFLIASVLAATRWRGLRHALWIAAAIPMMGDARADQVSQARKSLQSGDHEAAREAYGDLAGSTAFDGRRARFRLGEGTAALRGGDFRAARDAFSGALLAQDPAVRENAHHGLGQSLFQLGWKTLDDNPYPADEKLAPSMDDFDELVRQKLDAMRESGENAEEMRRLQSLVTNWADAVRHFDSANGLPAAQQNRRLAMGYLNRLLELIKEDRDQTEQSLPEPEPQAGRGTPQDGDPQDGESDDPQDHGESGDDEPRDSGSQDSSRDDPQDGGDDGPRESDGPRGNQDPPDESAEQPVDPNESPEDRARRILSENADLETGPPTPGRHEFNPPEKDW